MKEILSHLILPLPLFWIAFILSIVFRLLKKNVIARRLAWIAFAWLFLITTPFLPDLLVRKLENQYSPVSAKTLKSLDTTVNILVLGGGFINDTLLPANDQLSEIALVRLSEGIRIMRLLPESKLITSGWGNLEDISAAEVSAKTAEWLGVDTSRLSFQKQPENTWQEATEYKRLHPDSCRLIVVTSAIHMPRSIYLFRKAGLDPIAAPSNHLVKKSKQPIPWYWLPSSENIRKMEAAIHEYIGLIWYKIGGS